MRNQSTSPKVILFSFKINTIIKLLSFCNSPGRQLTYLPTFICACLLTLSFSQISAEEVTRTTGSTGTSGPGSVLEEITVTARKREESLQDTPISVTAFTGADLDRRGISNLRDVQLQTPALSWSAGPAGGSAGQYFIRGIGQSDWIASNDPGVGVYINNAYLGRVTGATLDLVDVERIEVLRGPQGTLFGRNTIGGAINVISAKPSEAFSGDAEVSIGERDNYQGKLKVNMPLIEDQLLSKVSVMASTRDGWGKRLFDNDRSGDTEKFAGHAAILWTPKENIEININADYLNQDGTGEHASAIALSQFLYPNTQQFITEPPFTENWASLKAPDDLDVWGLSTEINVELSNDLSFKSITTYRDMEHSSGLDFDSTPSPLLEQLIFTEQNQVSQEFQLIGNSLDGRLDWLVGLYYFQEDVEQFIDVTIAFPTLFFVVSNPQLNIHDNESLAAFAHMTFNVTEKLSVTGGVRYTYEKKEQFYDHANIHGAGSFLPAGTVQPTVAPTTVDESWTSFTPKVGLEYQFTDDFMGYFSYSEGFRSGGFNGRPSNINEITPYDPEEVSVFEIGTKVTLLNRRLRINAAAFYNDYTDLQLGAQLVVNGAPALTIQNAGESRLLGGEIELFAHPLPNLDLNIGISYLDQEFKKLDPNVTGVTLDSRAIQTPEWQANIGVQYKLLMGGNGSLLGRVDHAYKSGQFFFLGGPLEYQGNEHVTNAKLTYMPVSEKWELSLFVWNAFDKEYATFKEDALSAFGTALYWPARPREWGASVTYHF